MRSQLMVDFGIVNDDLCGLRLAVAALADRNPVLPDEKVVQFAGLVDVDSEHLLGGRFPKVSDGVVEVVKEGVSSVEVEGGADAQQTAGRELVLRQQANSRRVANVHGRGAVALVLWVALVVGGDFGKEPFDLGVGEELREVGGIVGRTGQGGGGDDFG